MQYIFYKKKLINGKKRRVYKKKGSKKLYLKYKGRMVNVVKYKKYLKKKQKKVGGFFNTKKITFGQRVDAARAAAVKLRNKGIEKYEDYNRAKALQKAKREKNTPDNNPWTTRVWEQTRQQQLRNQQEKRWQATQNKNPQYGIFNFKKKKY